MKKLICIAAVLAMCVSAFGEMDNFELSTSLITTNSASKTQFIRGTLEGFEVDCAAGKTNVFLVTYGPTGAVLLSRTNSTDAAYSVVFPTYNASGVGYTETISVWNNITNSTAAGTALLTKMALAGEVTIRINGAADTVGTNAVSCNLLFSK